ncbi:MAG: dodecin domain-containing protein [Firmicutes bacterium]|nr:dodecin domain-containing protein [Bacillota bacterium]
MVVKVIELVGESKENWEDAIQNAVSEASKTVRNISGVEVLNFTCDVEDGKITDYKCDVHVAFKVDGK